jgi:hypothetical protein
MESRAGDQEVELRVGDGRVTKKVGVCDKRLWEVDPS